MMVVRVGLHIEQLEREARECETRLARPLRLRSGYNFILVVGRIFK